MRDGMDFRAESEGRRVEVSQQPERKGSFVLDPGGQLPDVEFGSGRRLQEFEVCQFEGRQRAVLHHFRAAEKITLEQRVSHFHGRREFLLSFHFFGQHANVLSRVPGNNGVLFLWVREAEIHLDDVRERNQGRPVGRIHEIIERDRVSSLLQALAGFDDFLVRIDVFENFDHHRIGRKKRNIVPKQEIARTVDEHAVSRGDFFKADQKRCIQDGRGSQFEIQPIAGVLHAAAKKQFVGEQFARAIQDGLASQIFHGRTPSRSIKCQTLRRGPKMEGGMETRRLR